MPAADYAGCEALNPFFEIVQKGLAGLVDGEHFFDAVAEDASFDFRYRFPGWPPTIRGRADGSPVLRLWQQHQASFSRWTVVHHSQDRSVVILEYDIHGTVLSHGIPYDNRFVSVVTIKNKKIVHWRDYMDSGLLDWR